MKLFFSTFLLIFLAELGDKTQLATMARAATHSAPWSVFLGAAVALVASTLVAVLLGGILNAIAPPFAIQATAGVLFLVFGSLLLASAVRTAKAAPPVEAEAIAPTTAGWLAGLTLQSAVAFEEATATHYRGMAEAETDEDMKRLWSWLYEEELGHVESVRNLAKKPEAVAGKAKVKLSMPALSPETAREAGEVIAHAIEYERATADFYDALARDAHIPTVARTLRALARDEREHAEALAGVPG